jgi:PKD domain
MLVSAKGWCVVTSAALLLGSAGEAQGQGGMLAWDSSDPNMLILGYSVSIDGNSTDYGISPVGGLIAGVCGCAISLPFSGGRHTIIVTAYGSFGQIHSAPFDVGPVANAGGPYEGQVGLAVSFDGRNSTSPNGWITHYSWQWGDGTNTTSLSPTTSHAFERTGTFNITLTTTDNAGATASSTVTAVITAGASLNTSAPAGVMLSATPSSIQTNGSIQVTWSGISSSFATDWIGIYDPNAPDSLYLDWMYVSCSQNPTAPRASGSCAVQINLPAGTYQLRLFANDGYTSLITDPTTLPTITVGAVLPPPAPPPTTLTATPTSVGTGGTIQVTWSGIASPSARDWIGIFDPNAPNTSNRGWTYVSCTQTPSAPRASGSCAAPMTLPEGTYQLRLFSNDSLTSLITNSAQLPTITVTP